MSKKTNKTTPKKEAPDPLKIITKAGKLNYSIDQTIKIVCSIFWDISKKDLSRNIITPGTDEYDAYQTGKSIRLFDIEDSLYESAASGDNDARETILKLQVDKDISEAIKNSFFPDENTECE